MCGAADDEKGGQGGRTDDMTLGSVPGNLDVIETMVQAVRAAAAIMHSPGMRRFEPRGVFRVGAESGLPSTQTRKNRFGVRGAGFSSFIPCPSLGRLSWDGRCG